MESAKDNTASESTSSIAYVSGGMRVMHSMLKLWITIEVTTMKKNLPAIHPGEILQEEFLDPMGISQYRLANDIGVSPRRINEIVHGTRAITANTALRLGRYFGTTAQFWLNLQAHYDLEVESDRLGNRLQEEVHAFAPA